MQDGPRVPEESEGKSSDLVRDRTPAADGRHAPVITLRVLPGCRPLTHFLLLNSRAQGVFPTSLTQFWRREIHTIQTQIQKPGTMLPLQMSCPLSFLSDLWSGPSASMCPSYTTIHSCLNSVRAAGDPGSPSLRSWEFGSDICAAHAHPS